MVSNRWKIKTKSKSCGIIKGLEGSNENTDTDEEDTGTSRNNKNKTKKIEEEKQF